MNESKKTSILDAWIMLERLIEGDLDIKKTSFFEKSKSTPGQYDYFELFSSEISKKSKAQQKTSGKSADDGIIVYLGVFDFSEVLALLRKNNGIDEPAEEPKSSKKFSISLWFDRDLHLKSDRTFCSASGYIKANGKVYQQSDFMKYENEISEFCQSAFSDTESEDDPNGDKKRERFNKAFEKVLIRYNINIESCRFKYFKSKNDDAALHSFFTDDLERAKKISCPNLDAYIFGNTGTRVDLNTRSTSARFNPEALKKILMPENYPLARFPSATKFSLSLMQQIAVNLAVAPNGETIMSVNGPPGTGKTTLLKDIFAELVVEQAHDIVRLAQKRLPVTEKSLTNTNISIAALPESIADKNIIVASSNNGAVKNISGELPLIPAIDSKYSDKLDYFRWLSNKMNAKSAGDDGEAPDDGKAPVSSEKTWGIFSLEGGRKDKMDALFQCIKDLINFLNNKDDEKYTPDAAAYEKFRQQYQKVSQMRSSVQKLANKSEEYIKAKALSVRCRTAKALSRRSLAVLLKGAGRSKRCSGH